MGKVLDEAGVGEDLGVEEVGEALGDRIFNDDIKDVG